MKTHVLASILVAVLAILAGIGCSPATPPAEKSGTPEEAQPTQAAPPESETAEPAEPEPVAPAEPEEAEAGGVSESDVESAEDWFAWYDLRETYRESGETSAALEAAFETKAEQLREENPVYTIADTMEILAFDLEVAEENIDEDGNAQMRTRMLINKRKPLELEEGEKAQLRLRLVADKSEEERLLKLFPQAYKYKCFDFKMPDKLDDEDWPPQGTRMVVYGAQIPAVPYQAFAYVALKSQEGEYLGRLGGEGPGMIDLGWWVDLPEEDQA